MHRLAPWLVAALVGGAAVAAAGWRFLVPDRGHYEEPSYTIDAQHDGFEVRSYGPTLQAQVTMPGSREQATRDGFRVLAGYIFGGNTARQGIDMTTPVSAAPSAQSIDMTTPVSAAPEGDGWTVAFTMPSRWTLDTLPVPDDERVRVLQVPGHRAAVRTFTGRATARRVEDQQRALAEAMQAVGLAPDGAPILAQFDPPWVLGPWRRNEVQVGIAP